MAEFFIPGIATDQVASVYDAVKRHTEDCLGGTVSNRKIGAIAYMHNGQPLMARVGHKDPMEPYEIVMAILGLEQQFAICTQNRGVLRGDPIQVSKHNVEEIIDFDELDNVEP